MKPLRSTYGPGHLLGGMPYTNSAATDLRALFDRIKREAEQRDQEDAEYDDWRWRHG